MSLTSNAFHNHMQCKLKQNWKRVKHLFETYMLHLLARVVKLVWL
jgi:hypothetical protein